MEVYGVTIPNEVLSLGLEVMNKEFVAADVVEAMKQGIAVQMRAANSRHMVSEVAMRAADRLIQKEKKALAIQFNQQRRVWVPTLK